MSGDRTVGAGLAADPDVLIAYPPSRAIADLAFRLGDRARLRSGTVLYAGSAIGDDFETGHHVVVREENRIGDRCSVWSGSTVDYGCSIGSGVRIHCNCYLAQFTVLEDEVFLGPGVTTTNDLHPGCERFRDCLRGPVIERGARIGANATILPGVRVGRYALIGAGSVVASDVPAGAVAWGNPAVVRKKIQELTCSTGLTDRPYGSEEQP